MKEKISLKLFLVICNVLRQVKKSQNHNHNNNNNNNNNNKKNGNNNNKYGGTVSKVPRLADFNKIIQNNFLLLLVQLMKLG